MSKADTAILRDGKQLADVPPALQAVADDLRTPWETVSVVLTSRIKHGERGDVADEDFARDAGRRPQDRSSGG